MQMSPLYTKLQELSGPWAKMSSNKLKNILQISCCILKARSCNLQKCRDELSSVTGEASIKQATAYARLKRVFQTGVIRPLLKSLFLLVLYLICPGRECLLILDRTEFSVGRHWINLLVFGLEWQGVFIPLIWRDLGKRKVSTQAERIELLDRLLAWWKASKLDLPLICLVGDREFTGQDWIMALENRQIQYVIRIKSNLRFPVWLNNQVKDRLICLKTLARYMIRHQQNRMEILIHGTLVSTIMLMPQERSKAKENFVLLITNIDDWQQAQAIFRRRWPIECCFKHMKTNGFDLEALHLEGQHKINLLFGILTFVYVLAVHQGIMDQYEQQVKLKTQANGKIYREQSLFRFGLYQLKLHIKELGHLISYLLNFIQYISKLTKCKKLIFEKTIVQS